MQKNDYEGLIQKFKKLSQTEKKVLSKFFDEWRSNASKAHPQENIPTLTPEQQGSLTKVCKILEKAESSAAPGRKSKMRSIAKGVGNLLGRISSNRLALEAFCAKTKIGNKATAEAEAAKIEKQVKPPAVKLPLAEPQPKLMPPVNPDPIPQQPPVPRSIPQPSLQPAKPQQSMQTEPQLKPRPSQNEEEDQQLELAPLPPGAPPNPAVIEKGSHSLLSTECAHTKALLTKMGNLDYALNVKNGMVVLSKHEPQKEITSSDIEVIYRKQGKSGQRSHIDCIGQCFT